MVDEKLLQAVTEEVTRRLNSGSKPKVLLVCEEADCEAKRLFSQCFEVEVASSCANFAAYDYVVIPAEKLRSEEGAAMPACEKKPEECCAEPQMQNGVVLDFTEKKLLTEKDLTGHGKPPVQAVKVGAKTIVTALAKDYMQAHNIALVQK